MSNATAVPLFPLVRPFSVPPVQLRDMVVGTDVAHGLYNFHATQRWCSCCDEWRPATGDRGLECSAPFERNAA